MKKNKFIQLIYQLALIILIISCKTSFNNKTYVLDRELKFKEVKGVKYVFPQKKYKKSIVILSDSTLTYNVTYGDIGESTTIKYKLKNKILKIDTTDIYNRKISQNNTNEIFGYEFKYSNDSLIGINNGEKYYTYKSNKKRKLFYVIYKNKVYKIKNQKSVNKLFDKIENYDLNKFVIMNENIAYEKYGINKKYQTFEYK